MIIKNSICFFSVTLFLLVFVLPIDCQQKTEDPIEILKKSDEACQKIKSIEYEQKSFHAEHKDIHPFLTANIKQVRADVPDTGLVPGKYLISGKINTGNKTPIDFSMFYDGKYLGLSDSSEKLVRVVKSPSEYTTGSMTVAYSPVGVRQFTSENFFKTIIEKGEKITYEGTKEIEGELCHIISITITKEHPTFGKISFVHNWLIGAKDFLPRGLESKANQEHIRILKINDLNLEKEYFANHYSDNDVIVGKRLQIKGFNPQGFEEKLVTGKEAKTNGLMQVGSDAPEWSLVDEEGNTHLLSNYRGKVVVMDFWGTWCAPCIKSMPGIQILHERFKNKNVAVFGISVAEEGDPALFMKKKGFTYGLLLKGDDVAKTYRAQTLPTIYIIGKDGKILHAEFGYRPSVLAELIKVIEQNL